MIRQLKERKIAKDNIVHHLETNCCFRDYRILPKKLYGKVSHNGTAIHHCFSLRSNPITHQYEIDDAVSDFCKNGANFIYFYL